MDRISVNSSAIAGIGYDATTTTLEVCFKRGAVYQFFDVPDVVHQEFMQADSKGTFFNNHIKNDYRCTKL